VDRHRVYNVAGLRERRRDLRKRSTEAEMLLWMELRESQLGFRFKRQYSVSGYVLDFYCPRCKLGIEIDGGVHKGKEAMGHDLHRTEYLRSFGIRVIRFWNRELVNNLDDVIEIIRRNLTPRPSP